MNNNISNDLLFVNNLDIESIRKSLAKKYQQTNPTTEFQDRIKKQTFGGNRAKDYKREYGIQVRTLELVYARLEEKAKENGIDIEYHDLSEFTEDEFYGNEFEDPSHEEHAETARSDGKTLVLEKDIERAGSITGRLYDLLHLAYGHMVQWSTDDSRALLTKEEAWAIGYRNHEGSPDKILDLMALYELEAGMMGVHALQSTLLEMESISVEEKEAIIQYFTDYVYVDSKYIIQHYRGNRHKFEEYFTAGNPVPQLVSSLHVAEYIQRQTVEIGLIRDKQQ